MDSRGSPATAPIARRSCDQCHSRKIACDRGSPCSNCVNSRMECTHSARAVKSTPSKQRVLISSQYEQKIDDIVRDVSLIKAALQGSIPKNYSNEKSPETTAQFATEVATEYEPGRPTKRRKVQPVKQKSASSWDHSAQIIDFVKSVAESSTPEGNHGLASSLKSLGHAVTNSSAESQLHGITALSGSLSELLPIPPLNAVLPLLRWVKAHQHYHRVKWISQLLPIAVFEDLCRKVYFAVDEYTHVDYILVVGFLSYMFSEHRVVTGTESSADHGQMCRDALSEALSRLPFILPSTLEVIAALLMATLYSIESSKSMSAWTYISSAVNHCQTLRYHRISNHPDPKQAMGNDLFLSVYRFEKGLALRLGRPSGIRDTEITLPVVYSGNRATRSARIQGQVYDQLYRLGGLSDFGERGRLARLLAEEVRGILMEIRAEISQCLDERAGDVMQELYLKGDLVCHTSLLALVLRAVPLSAHDTNVSNKCLMAAREVFELHEQCMTCVRNCNDPPTTARYLNWAILHVPFVPFSILFTRAIQLSDPVDLDRLGRFAESLKPDSPNDEKTSATHPYRLYDLLYQTARFYVESDHRATTTGSAETTGGHGNGLDTPHEGFGSEYINDTGEYDPMLGLGQINASMMDLGEWFQGNQQLVRLLDEGVPF